MENPRGLLQEAAEVEMSSADTVDKMPAMRKVDRDLAEQLAAVRALASRGPIIKWASGARETLAVRPPECSPELSESAAKDRGSEGPTKVLFDENDMMQRLAWARRLRPDAREGVLAALQRTADAGRLRRAARPGSAAAFTELRGEFPHFNEVLDFVWRRAVLASSVNGAAFWLPPMLFDGPPGLGKSAFAERLATWLAVPMTRVDMASLDAAFKLTGLDAGYSTGKPGIIWDSLQGAAISPVLLLDELDKTATINAGSSAFLLGLLEPLTASRFQDACIGLPINAAHIQWLATSNDRSTIDAPLLSRFRAFDIRLPTGDQRVRVVQSVYRSLRGQELWAQAFPESLPQPVLDALIDRSAREVRQTLEDACASAVADGRRHLRVADIPAPAQHRKQPIGFLSTNSMKG